MLSNRKTPERRGKVQLINGQDLYEKMRKGLGEKRKMLGDDHIAEIVRVHGEGGDATGDRSLLLLNEDFGYRNITVEQPLRLNFAADQSRREAALADKALSRLPETSQAAIQLALEALDQDAAGTVWKDRSTFRKALDQALADQMVAIRGPQRKALVMALAERDERAEIVRGTDGKAEPDPKLRQTENVPLREAVEDYFEREVRPYLPEAWIDHSKTKIGYEIPFTRHFYKYTAPRRLSEIDADLKHLIEEMSLMLREVEV